MKKKTGLLPILCGLLFLFFSGSLLAEEQLMTKLFFDSWLQKQIQPLEDSISQLKGQYAVLHQEATQIRESLRVEIEIVIGQKRPSSMGKRKRWMWPAHYQQQDHGPCSFCGRSPGSQFCLGRSNAPGNLCVRPKEIVLYIEQKQAYINGEKVILDTAGDCRRSNNGAASFLK